MVQSKSTLVPESETLPGRSGYAFVVPEVHAVSGARIQPPFPEGTELATFALGCFWGAERLYWELPGVVSTFVGYMGGTTPYPTYKEVCSGHTNHAEAVGVVFDPAKVSFAELVKVFLESHDPTQGMRQGGDVGTQYRSEIFAQNDEQRHIAETMVRDYGTALQAAGLHPITTAVSAAGDFYYAEDYHQQYLHKVPNGYCGIGGTGVSCPIPYKRAVEVPMTTEENVK